VIRIFFTLAVFALVCVAAALFLGVQVGELHEVIGPDVSPDMRQQTIERASVHRQAGLVAAIVVIFANSISVTYFIGTSRWCREVIVGVAALGAAADPGTGLPNTADWVLPHFLAGLVAMAFLGFSFFVQAANIRAHYGVIGDIMIEVRKAREARGLAV
jgi:hypothetical protein